MANDMAPHTPQGEIILYQPDETVRLEVRLENETVWLTQAQMAELFGRERTVIGRHINNCFKEGELTAEMVSAKFAHTTQHGALEGKVTNINGRGKNSIFTFKKSIFTRVTCSF